MTRVLIHIGYPKSGSTYLQTWFGKHPSMLYKGLGVAGFYNTHDIASYAEKSEKVHEHFILSNEDLSAWKGDVDIVGIKGTGLYDIAAYHEKMSETLHRLFPQAKVLIVTRGYESMFKSIYSQYLSSGGVFTFEELQNEFKRFFPTGYNYSAMVELFRKKFGKDNVLVYPYELLREDPACITSMIEKELGVKESFSFTTEKINPSLDKKTLRAYRTASNIIYRLVKPFPYSFQRIVYGLYLMRLNKRKPHPFMDFLGKFYKDGVDMSIQSDVREMLTGKAELLRSEPLFQPYLKEYWLE